jgi:hypothetical protein
MQVCKNLAAIQNRVNMLEAAGWRIRLIHDPMKTRTTLMLAVAQDEEAGQIFFAGQSHCVHEDQFCRSTGTRIAFDRLIHHMSAGLGRKTVKQIFE